MKVIKNVRLYLLFACTLAFLAACAPLAEQGQPSTEPATEQLTIYVGPQLVDCVGVAPQECMQVKFNPEDEWQFFYDQIAGFDYEPGYEYELLVQRTTVENPPADASAFQYDLIDVASKTAVQVADAHDLVGTVWQLQEIQMMNDTIETPADAALYTLELMADGRFAGRNDCNQISGGYTLTDNGLSFAEIVSTLAMCAPESLYDRYLQGLTDAHSFVLEEGKLFISFGPDAGILKFAPAAGSAQQEQSGLPIEALQNAPYQGIYTETVALSNGVYEGEPFVAGGAARPRVELIDSLVRDGDLNGDNVADAAVVLVESSGGSGVFNYLAAVINTEGAAQNVGTLLIGDRTQIKALEIHDGQIVLDIVTQGPDDAACCPSLKENLVYAVQEGALVQISRTEEGAVSSTDLEGTNWVLTAINRDAQRVGDVAVTLTFDGADVYGSSGCNSYNSSVLSAQENGAVEEGASPQSIQFAPPVTTRMACPDPVMTVESDFIARLSAVTQWSYLAGDLALIYQLEDEFGTLTFAPAQAE